MENVMQGIIDMHIHAAPDVRARKLDDLELMEASVQRGVRAIVLKSHNFPTIWSTAWQLKSTRTQSSPHSAGCA